MKKLLFQTIGNLFLFTLFGLAFLYPFTNVNQIGDAGFTATLTLFPILFIAYLILYPIVYMIFKKIFKWGKHDNSELAFSDEREKIIVAQATKTTYKVFIAGIIICVAVIAAVQFFSLFSHQDISIYFTSITLMTLLLIVATISYSVKWLVEYYR